MKTGMSVQYNEGFWAGMGGMTNQVIAADFLFAVKSDIKMLAAAIAESHTPEVRETLTQYLNDSIDKHQEITDYMVSKGFYYPNDLAKQLGVYLQAAATASSLAQNQNQGQNQHQGQSMDNSQNQDQGFVQNQNQNQSHYHSHPTPKSWRFTEFAVEPSPFNKRTSKMGKMHLGSFSFCCYI
jgi:similar to spore coat protein